MMNHDAVANRIFWSLPEQDRADARQVQALATARGKSRSWAVINWRLGGVSIDSPKRQGGRVEIGIHCDSGDELETPAWLAVSQRTTRAVELLDRLDMVLAIATAFQRSVLRCLIDEMSPVEIAAVIGAGEMTVVRAIVALRRGLAWSPDYVMMATVPPRSRLKKSHSSTVRKEGDKTMIILVSLLVAIIGVLVYALSGNPKVSEMGRIAFAFGLLAFLLRVGDEAVKFFR